MDPLAEMIRALSKPQTQFDDRFGAAEAARANGTFKGYHMSGGLQPADTQIFNFISSLAPNGIPWQQWSQSTNVEDMRNDPNSIHYQTETALPDLKAAYAIEK